MGFKFTSEGCVRHFPISVMSCPPESLCFSCTCVRERGRSIASAFTIRACDSTSYEVHYLNPIKHKKRPWTQGLLDQYESVWLTNWKRDYLRQSCQCSFGRKPSLVGSMLKKSLPCVTASILQGKPEALRSS